MPSQRRSDLEVRHLDDEIVILDLSSGEVHRLNPTASVIWNACDGQTTAAEIAARLAERFGLPPGGVLKDVTQTIADLQRLGLLVDPADRAETPRP